VIELSWEQVLAFRLVRHCLDQRLPLGGAEVASRINGVQAQVMSAAELSIGARSSSESSAGVQQGLWEKRSLVKTWAMRTTLHLLPAEELPLFMAAVRRRSEARERTWLKYFGLEAGQVLELVEAVGRALDGRCLTRRELAEAVAGKPSGMSLEQLLSGWGTYLGLPARHGKLIFGPSLGTSVRFVRPDQWIGSWKEVDEIAAEKELLRRYLRVNGPAVRNDFQLWLGATPSLPAWKAVLPEMAEVSVEGRRGWLLAGDVDAVRAAKFGDDVRLLPFFDHYLLTHHTGREHLVAAEHKAKVYRTAGWVTPTVLVRGRIAGTWDLTKGVVTVSEFQPLTARERRGVAREVERLGHFLGASVRLG
jgi:winged helix DNA-binding protein